MWSIEQQVLVGSKKKKDQVQESVERSVEY